MLLVRSGGFAVPEFIYVSYGTTEVVCFHETSRARACPEQSRRGARATPANIKGLCVTFHNGNAGSTLLPLRLTLSSIKANL